jgi:hypothetical protein
MHKICASKYRYVVLVLIHTLLVYSPANENILHENINEIFALQLSYIYFVLQILNQYTYSRDQQSASPVLIVHSNLLYYYYYYYYYYWPCSC